MVKFNNMPYIIFMTGNFKSISLNIQYNKLFLNKDLKWFFFLIDTMGCEHNHFTPHQILKNLNVHQYHHQPC